METLEKKKTPREVGDENKQKILDCYTDYVEVNGKAPTMVYLAEKINLTRPIIYKHLKSLQINELAQKFKPRAFTILEGIAKKAEDGDVAAAKLMLQLAFGWNEKKIVENTNTNRSLKIIFTNPTDDELKKIVNNEQTEQAEYTIEDEPNE